ncbi:hypothetical protein AN958_05059 [Leucoagaricus sp. SymC.cos]|nr:hypothetical protein AN958_05059 [Leucoagaricus sp. SymC.cos]
MSSTDPPSSSQTPAPSSPTTTPSSSPSMSTTTTTTTTTSPTSSTTTTSSSTTSSTTTSEPPDTTTASTTTSEPPTTTTSEPPDTTTSTTTSSTPEPTHTRPPDPTTTFSSTVFISTTDGRGSPTRTAPSQITSTLTSTGSDGAVITVTQVIANPSLLPNSPHSKTNGFFGNTGAVAAVFVLVGLAVTSIALFVFFSIRRRQRRNRVERDIAVAASQAALTPRSPLDDDDDPQGPHFSSSALEMSQRRSSSGLASTYLGPRLSYHDDPDHPEGFNPYADFSYPASGPIPPNKDGYTIARTSSPPVAYFNNASHDRSRRPSAGSFGSASGQDGYIKGTHSIAPSGASYEPLLAAYYRQSSGSGQLPGSPVLVTPPATATPAKTPQAPSDDSSQPLVDDREHTEAHSMFTSDTTDDRLDPGLRRRQKEAESASMKDLKDEEDYSRPVLGVRNLP